MAPRCGRRWAPQLTGETQAPATGPYGLRPLSGIESVREHWDLRIGTGGGMVCGALPRRDMVLYGPSSDGRPVVWLEMAAAPQATPPHHSAQGPWALAASATSGAGLWEARPVIFHGNDTNLLANILAVVEILHAAVPGRVSYLRLDTVQGHRRAWRHSM